MLIYIQSSQCNIKHKKRCLYQNFGIYKIKQKYYYILQNSFECKW